MDWLKIKMPPSTSESDVPVGVTTPFHTLYKRHDEPKDFCVFLLTDANDRVLYLSPVAKTLSSQLIEQLRAQYEISECDAPSPFAVRLVAGDSRFQSW